MESININPFLQSALFQMAHLNHHVDLRISGVVFPPLIMGLSVQILVRQNRAVFSEKVFLLIFFSLRLPELNID